MPGPIRLLEEVLDEESFGILIHASNQKKNVQGDADSCPFTTNTFRPERESAKKQKKLICVVCNLPVNRAISIVKRLEGLDDEGQQ